jgi:hypothetical protein
MKTIALHDVIIFSTNNLQVHSKQNEKPTQMPISPIGIMKRLTTHADISLLTVAQEIRIHPQKEDYMCVNNEKISEQSIQNFCHEKRPQQYDLHTLDFKRMFISVSCFVMDHSTLLRKTQANLM